MIQENRPMIKSDGFLIMTVVAPVFPTLFIKG